jgi:hypothetical protein
MGAIFFHCASVSNGPLRAIGPPSALLILLISHYRKLNHSLLNALYNVVQQLLVKVVANNYDAENGRYAGGQVQVTFANGTNEFHGSVFRGRPAGLGRL